MTPQIGSAAYEAAAKYSDDVDRSARFPREAVDALRADGLLGALVPAELGGLGLDIATTAEVAQALGRACSSTGLIFAMHQGQLASLVRHSRSAELTEFARRVASEQLLLASATTEINIGGNTRMSGCHVQRNGDDVLLEKNAPVISYGAHADAVLVTARRAADAASNDQVLVVCERANLELEETSGWDTLGFRGTCSCGYLLTARTTAAHIVDDPFETVSSQTMLPVSHLMWSSVWLGMAEAAETTARRYVQAQARKKIGTVPPGALRLVELRQDLQRLRESVRGMLRSYAEIQDDPIATADIGFASAINTLKVSASTAVVGIVDQALAICGISGYRNGSDYELGRVLRDAHGAALMVNNDRILANNADLVLMLRGEGR